MLPLCTRLIVIRLIVKQIVVKIFLFWKLCQKFHPARDLASVRFLDLDINDRTFSPGAKTAYCRTRRCRIA